MNSLMGYVCLAFRPIPQWFRLKTDTKIQVRVADYADALSYSVLPSVQCEAASLAEDQTQHLICLWSFENVRFPVCRNEERR